MQQAGSPSRADGALQENRLAVRTERLAVAALAALLLVLVSAFVYQFLPFVRYPYEADPSDGDMLNALMRGLGGKPIYGDWRTGTVTLLYPPLFLGILGLAHAVGLEPITCFRSVNLAFFVLSVGLVVIMASVLDKGHRRFAAAGLLAGIFVMSAWRHYFWLAPVHPAMLLLLISLGTCAILALRPGATVALALCCSLAVLTKQSGIGLLLAVLIHLAVTDRKRIPRFAAVAGGSLALAVILFELQSHGQFLRSILLYPGKVFSDQWVSFAKVFGLATELYGGRLWLLPLVGLGLLAVRRTALFPLAVVFGVDAAVELYLARSVAGSASYLWFHFALASVLAAQGWQWLITQASRRMRLLAGAPALSLLTVLLGCICLATDGRDLLSAPRVDLTRAKETSRLHAQVVTSLLTAHPHEKWIVTRSSLAAVRAGALLDQEYATFAIAWTHPTLIDRSAVRQRVAAGEYTYVQLGPTGLTFDPLAEVFAACFVPVARSTLIYQGRPSPTIVLRHDGTRSACQSLRLSPASGSRRM
jgi:hypothetical protein